MAGEVRTRKRASRDEGKASVWMRELAGLQQREDSTLLRIKDRPELGNDCTRPIQWSRRRREENAVKGRKAEAKKLVSGRRERYVKTERTETNQARRCQRGEIEASRAGGTILATLRHLMSQRRWGRCRVSDHETKQPGHSTASKAGRRLAHMTRL